jgi:hypothetical protein
MRDWDLFNESAVMYFPRVLALDKLRGHFESFAPCGAAAGMLARADDASPMWSFSRSDEAVLRPGYRPTCLVSEDRRIRLASFGVDTIQAVRSAARIGVAARTLAAGSADNADWKYLAPRRFALFVLNSIERGTRWVAIMAQPHAEVAEQASAQVRAFFGALQADRAFGPETGGPAPFFAACSRQGDEYQLALGFAARLAPGLHSFRITHSAKGSTVRGLTLSQLGAQMSPAELEWVDGLAQRLFH